MLHRREQGLKRHLRVTSLIDEAAKALQHFGRGSRRSDSHFSRAKVVAQLTPALCRLLKISQQFRHKLLGPSHDTDGTTGRDLEGIGVAHQSAIGDRSPIVKRAAKSIVSGRMRAIRSGNAAEPVQGSTDATPRP